MPEGEEFQEAVDLTKTSLEQIGDEVVEELPTPPEAPEGSRLIRCQHGELTFLVTAEPDRAFFELVYPLNLVANLAQQVRSEPELRTFFERDGDDLSDDEDALEVARSLLDSMPPLEKQRLIFHLIERLSSPKTSFRTEETGGGGLAGFESKRKIFPYEDSFSLARLNEAVQSVISVGHRATQFIYNTLIFDISKGKGEPEIQLRFRHPDELEAPEPDAIEAVS